MKISKNKSSINPKPPNKNKTKKDKIINSTKKLVFTILLSILPNNNNSLELKWFSFSKQESQSPELISTTKQIPVNLNSFNDIFNNNCKSNTWEVINDTISSIECFKGFEEFEWIKYQNPLTKIKNDWWNWIKYSISWWYNKKLSPETNIIVNKLSSTFGLDSNIMKKLILHESQWKINALSYANAQWIMQIIPSTVRDLWVRFNLYDDRIIKAWKAILPILKNWQLKTFLEQYILSNNEKRKNLLFQFETSLFDHDMNIFAWVMIFIQYIDNASKQSDLEKKLYDTIVWFDESNFQKINTRRAHIWAPPLDKDIFISNFTNYFNNENSNREYITYLLALAWYNGWKNLKPDAVAYALVIWWSFFMKES